MADYFTHFSCQLDVGSSEKVRRALNLYENAEPDEDGRLPSDGFILSLPDDSGTRLWIHDEVSGDPDLVIAFVLHCAVELDLKGLWGFAWAATCSRPRLDAFGGGAHVIDLGARKIIGWVTTDEWLCDTLVEGGLDA
ncbi:MAG TPA: hypothetical protein VFG62_19945 [Rhodopila sp.]|jgi:hypothetical protein|nr:hypothetical protein [Rhodopila sp.]